MVYSEQTKVIPLNNLETKVFLETKLRNLKRKQAKLSQYSSLTEEYFEIDKEIQNIEAQLSALQ